MKTTIFQKKIVDSYVEFKRKIYSNGKSETSPEVIVYHLEDGTIVREKWGSNNDSPYRYLMVKGE